MSTPQELKYTQDHEWILVDGTLGRMGITDYAQHALGDITFIELPKMGRVVKAGEIISTVESVKAASDIYAPVGGTVSKLNHELDNALEIVNKSPYKDGWICELSQITSEDLAKLMTAKDYDAFVKGLDS